MYLLRLSRGEPILPNREDGFCFFSDKESSPGPRCSSTIPRPSKKTELKRSISLGLDVARRKRLIVLNKRKLAEI